jgi:hypothetical protein
VALVDPHLQKLRQEIESAVAGLSPEQLSWHEAEKWCSAEILEHLYLTYTGTTKGFGRVLAGDKPLASKASWKNRAQAMVVVGFGYLPEGRKSPPHASPRGIPAEKVKAEIISAIGAMDEVMDRCAAKFGAGAKVLDHPFLGPFSVNQWRKFHLVHGRHHVKQIRRLREKLENEKV